MKILSLDLSINRTGYAIFKNDNLIHYGSVEPILYSGWKKERYPQQTIRKIRTVINQLLEIIEKKGPFGIILIEEVNPNPKSGVKSIKGLAMLHGHFLGLLDDQHLNKTQIITTSEWRSALNIKKNSDWKQSSIEMVEELVGLKLQYIENDEADAINMGLAFLKSVV